MSGTSLDGIDLAEIFFNVSEQGNWTFKIGKAETVPYDENWKTELREGIELNEPQLEKLDFKYTDYLAQVISQFFQKHNFSQIDAVCSHGHTILHKPNKGITYQIGNLPRIAKLLGLKVICDFRVGDVALGGQGAPLVPIGDKLLFNDYDYCVNLGGFANLSFEKKGNRIAFDICPANIVLNHYAEMLGKPYDENGDLAASGKVNENLLDELNSLPFYAEKAPKSLGLEWVRDEIFPILKSSEDNAKNILRTFTEHIAVQLADQFSENSKVLFTGGGVFNSFLMKRLKEISNIEIVIPSKETIEYKEALIFGLLGVLKLREEINCLASVTGAKNDHSSGKIYEP